MTSDLLLGLAALLLLLVPGWLVARHHRLPLPSLVGFIFGAVGLVLLIQILEIVGLGLTVKIIVPAWLVIIGGAILASRRPIRMPAPLEKPGQTDWFLMGSTIPAMVVVGYRAIAQPLFGIDTIFRWNFLAEQMLARGTIGFYPPVTGAEYAIYSWPDGIAPLVSSLYFWSYAIAGAARPVVTAPFVIFQFFLITATVHAFARKLASARAAAIACALVACSPLVLWSTAMGQETGLTAIGLLALLFYLPESGESAKASATIVAGLATALCGLAREYGLVFIFFGLALGMARRLSLRTLSVYLVTVLIATLPWYMRNWLHTGNPLFNHDVAGLFPVNQAHLRLMEIYQASFGWNQLPSGAGWILSTNCIAALIGGIAGTLVCFKQVRPLLAGVLLVMSLWIASLSYTAAGFTYSLRVLTPGLTICAVLGGMGIARLIPARRHVAGLSLALLIFACDAALRALVLPSNVYKLPPVSWLDVGSALSEYHRRPVYRQVADHTANQRILVLGPAALLNQNGAHTVPLWSPEVGFLWNASISPNEAAARLNGSGIGFALLNKGEVNRQYLAQIPFFRPSTDGVLQTVWEDDDMTLFKVTDFASPTIPQLPVPAAHSE